MANSTTGFPCPKTANLAGAKDPGGLLQPMNVDGSGNLKVAGTFTATNPSTGPTGSTAPTQATEVGGVGPDGNLHALSTDNSGQANVNVVSSALPSGASTSANQTTGNTSLASIDSKTPALGQALAAASSPVVLPAAQITALTPPTTVTVQQPTGTNLHAVIDSGTVSVSNQPTTMTVTQPTGSNLHTVVDSGTVTANQGTANATPWNENIAQFGGAAVSLGQKTMANSMPVALASDQAPLSVQNSALQLTTGSISALNGDVVAATDVSLYSAVLFQLTGTWSGTVTFQGSDDNITFYSVQATAIATANVAPVLSATAVGAWLIPVQARYLRIRVTAYTSGTVTGAGTALTNPPQDLGARNVFAVAGTITTVSAVTSITNALPAGTNVIGFTKQGGRAQAFAPVQLTYTTGSPVTTAAYTQLVASTTTAVTYLDIFDSSGQAMILATGASGSEVILAYIPPGGDQIAVTIAASTRLSIKALTANATSGYILLNGWN